MQPMSKQDAKRPNRAPRSRTLLWLLVLAGLIIVAVSVRHERLSPPSPTGGPADHTPATIEQLAAQLTALETNEQTVAEKVWASELLAEQCGAVFDALWDALNAAPDKLAVLRAFPVPNLSLPTFAAPRTMGHSLEFNEPGPAPQILAEAAWRAKLDQFEGAGWRPDQLEFRHNQFETNRLGQPRQSVFYARADLVNARQTTRATLSGDLLVDWAAQRAPDGRPAVERIDASRLRLIQRTGEPPFQLEFFQEIRPFEKTFFIDPLLVYDLDGDGLPEIILAARNLVFKRQADGSYTQRELCQHSPGLIFTAVLGDFDGDGVADFLCAVFEGLVLFKGSPGGRFDEPGQLVWTAPAHLKYGQVLTCGDIDHDGDLDVWLGQYKSPYDRGQMPTPYYDANDGNPSYLLLNDGHGHFSEATEAAGLGQKRYRRTYSASLVDLNDDGNLDLLTVSDFAGVDVYANDGHGHFADRTAQWLPERHLFGMAHTLADFNADGRLDFLVMGMHCPTAQRLDHLGLQRPGHPDYEAMRPLVTAGNRLFLGQAGGGFSSGPLGASISHSGWSWGCTAFDWDNDGYPDLYVANGHETRQSVKDYEPEFWLHDIYVANSRDDWVKHAYFGAKMARTRGRGQSYGGYEKNRLFLNQHGESFLEAGYPLGVALEADSRNVVSADLDGDGRVDLIVTTFEAWPKVRQTLRVFRNTLARTGNWIGFWLQEEGHGTSPIGARLTLRYSGKTVVRELVTGDSYRAQHPNTFHIGLGENTGVDSAEIRWVNGKLLKLEHPAVNRYHAVHPPP